MLPSAATFPHGPGGQPDRGAEQVPWELDQAIKDLLEIAGVNRPVTMAIGHAVRSFDLRDELAQGFDADAFSIEVDNYVAKYAVSRCPSHTSGSRQGALQGIDIGRRDIDVVQPARLPVRSAAAAAERLRTDSGYEEVLVRGRVATQTPPAIAAATGHDTTSTAANAPRPAW